MKNIIPVLFVLLLMACHKERFTTDPLRLLTTSADTLHFDTVFTTTGSITQVIKIFNPNSEGIRIASIRLMGGTSSPFTINANGTMGPAIENAEIAANDSTYVFATVTINTTSANMPFVVQDSIEIAYNGNKKIIQLEAYGQNARFLRHHKITGTEVWNAGLPYVLLGACVIDSGAHVIINEGCRIYLHADAPFIVKGRLTVHGKPGDSANVVFSGDRLDVPYRNLPGSWPGIVFTASSHDNNIQHAVLKNAYQAIAVEPSPVAGKLYIGETIIDNAYDAGLLADNANVVTQNLLVRNCGKGVVLRNGGDYRFTHATIAAFSTAFLPHKEPALTISNATATNSATNLNAVFRNCIFWGESSGLIKEVVVEKTENSMFNVLFDGVLWPLDSVPEEAMVTVLPITQLPEFDSISVENNWYDFHLKETSPACNSGVHSNVSLDLDGRSRPARAPDLGAYEKQ